MNKSGANKGWSIASPKHAGPACIELQRRSLYSDPLPAGAHFTRITLKGNPRVILCFLIWSHEGVRERSLAAWTLARPPLLPKTEWAIYRAKTLTGVFVLKSHIGRLLCFG
jgi:hypothetical protein